MKAVRRTILTIAKIVVLYFFIGLAATLWVIGLFLLYFGIARFHSYGKRQTNVLYYSYEQSWVALYYIYTLK